MKKLLTFLLAGIMIFALTACQGAATDDLSQIKANKEMVIGYTVYEPMNYTNDEGEFTGFDTEYAQAVCKKLGVEAKFVEITWKAKFTELAGKQIDCIWNGMTITDEVKENTNVSLAYVKNAQVIVVKKDSGITSTADLVDKTVTAELGSAGELQIKGDEENAAEENLAKATYVGMDKQTACLLEVKAGTADAAVLDWTLAKTTVGEGTDYADLMIVADVELATEEYGIGFRKDSTLTAEVDKITKELVADGTLTALAEKYGLALAPAISK